MAESKMRVGIIGAGWIAEKCAITLNGIEGNRLLCHCLAFTRKSKCFCCKVGSSESLWFLFRTYSG